MLTLSLVALATANPLASVQELAESVAERRQLPLVRPIDAVAYSEAELRDRIERSLREDYSATDAAGDTATLVVLGFAQPDLDLFSTYLDIFVEQIGGFYDAKEGRLFLVRRDATDLASEHRVVEHELVHALQDQSFGLSILDDRPADDSDVETALRALVEGDASFFTLVTVAGDFLEDLHDLPIGNGGALVIAEPGSALEGAPDLLARTLVFPYIEGASFVQALHATDGFRAVNSAYRSRPPLSTEQILHPERYLSVAPDWPIALSLPPMATLLPADTARVDEDTLGELGILSWLEGVGGQEVVGAPLGWGGDRYRTYVDPNGHITLAWLTTWDTPEDAARFQTSARGAVEALSGGRWRRDGTLRAGKRREALVRRTGPDVVVILGARRAVARALEERLRRDTTRAERSYLDLFTQPLLAPDVPVSPPAPLGPDGP